MDSPMVDSPMDAAAHQARRRARRVFTFNVMVVGASGLGKTTFVRTLMSNTNFNYKDPSDHRHGKTISIQTFSSTIELNTRNVMMKIIDTPGFGDKLDNSESPKMILSYVEEQFKAYLAEESKIQRNPKFMDPRVHVVLYFLDPCDKNLSELDIEFMRTLGRATNILPVIGRADSVSEQELANLKKSIMEQISSNDLLVYNFPIYSDDDEHFIKRNNQLEDLLPFTVVGSDSFHQVGSKSVRGRKYPWGVVEVENPEHCDFNALKKVLLKSHMDVLKEDTHEIHYEYYRKQELIRKEMEKNKEQGNILYQDVLSLKDAEEAEMRARKRRSRVVDVPIERGFFS